jgi:putative intracellular protease/amidase
LKTLALLYPGCIEFEILLAAQFLHKKFPVQVITPDGTDHVGANGMTIRAHGSPENVDTAEIRAVLLPGGDPASLVGNCRLNRLLQDLHSRGAILGAICAGPLLLDQAGLLSGKRIAHGYDEPRLNFLAERGFFQNVDLSGDPLVVEGNIVTARPEAFAAFAVEMGVLAGAIPAERREPLMGIYGGPGR